MDFIAPPPERLRKHPDWDTPQLDRKTVRRHHRIISVVDGMHRRGWIRDEQQLAFEKWERDLNKAERCHVPMCQYGRAFVGCDPEVDPLDLKMGALSRVRAATQAVGHPDMVRALALAALTETTLEKIGREIDHEKNQGRAITAGKKLLQLGTYQLAIHYQFIRGP